MADGGRMFLVKAPLASKKCSFATRCGVGLRSTPASGITKATARLTLLRWALFQFLIGNIEAQGKNLSLPAPIRSNSNSKLTPSRMLRACSPLP